MYSPNNVVHCQMTPLKKYNTKIYIFLFITYSGTNLFNCTNMHRSPFYSCLLLLETPNLYFSENVRIYHLRFLHLAFPIFPISQVEKIFCYGRELLRRRHSVHFHFVSIFGGGAHPQTWPTRKLKKKKRNFCNYPLFSELKQGEEDVYIIFWKKCFHKIGNRLLFCCFENKLLFWMIIVSRRCFLYHLLQPIA